MSGLSRSLRAAIRASLVAAAFAPSLALADDSASWRPDSNDPLTLALDLSEALLDRGVPSLADAELAKLAPDAATPRDDRNRFGRLALRAALDAGKLEAPEGRAAVLQRVETIRALVEGAESPDDAFAYFANPDPNDEPLLRYALALAKTYYSLGSLELESSTGDAAPRSPSLDASLALTQSLVKALPAKDARPFLYWHAKGTLANLADPKRVANAEKYYSALEKSARAEKGADWFFACAAMVETARASGDLELAGKRLKATLDALKARSDDPDAPHELAAELVAQEIRLLMAEGKPTDALRQATQETDLLDAPFPDDTKRANETFFDPFDDLNLARAELYWQAIPETPTQKELEKSADEKDGPRLARETLVDEARRVARLVGDPADRARCAILAQASGNAAGDWSALELAAQESFRAENWLEALDAYDRAAQSARDSGDADAEYRLRSTAAAIVDKLLRDKLLPADVDATQFREDAAARFDALGRERPEAPSASAFMLLAIEYREALGEDDVYSRFEYLKLFPSAGNRAEFALDLARRLLDEGEYDDALTALDYVANADPQLADALSLERAIADARLETAGAADRDAILTAALDRLLSRLSFAEPGPATTPDALAKRLDATNDWSLAPGDSTILGAFFDLALDSGAAQSGSFADSASRALDAWRGAADDEGTTGRIDALRLSLALSQGSEDAVGALLNELNSGAQVELTTLERALDLAQRSEETSRKRLAQFVLDALDASGDSGDRAALVRADALRLQGRAQDALNLFASLLKKDAKNVGASKGIARILTAQKDPKVLEKALSYWSDVAEALPAGAPEWWDAKEETIMIYCRLGQSAQAEKIAKALWLTRDDPSDPGRRKRWEKAIAASRGTSAEKPAEKSVKKGSTRR